MNSASLLLGVQLAPVCLHYPCDWERQIGQTEMSQLKSYVWAFFRRFETRLCNTALGIRPQIDIRRWCYLREIFPHEQYPAAEMCNYLILHLGFLGFARKSKETCLFFQKPEHLCGLWPWVLGISWVLHFTPCPCWHLGPRLEVPWCSTTWQSSWARCAAWYGCRMRWDLSSGSS